VVRRPRVARDDDALEDQEPAPPQGGKGQQPKRRRAGFSRHLACDSKGIRTHARPRGKDRLKGLEAGGLLSADYQAGLFDEHGKSRAQPSGLGTRGALDNLFGISRRDFTVAEDYGKVAEEVPGRHLGLAVMEPTVRAEAGQPTGIVGDVPYLVRKETGEGATLYLNLGVMDYGSERLTPEGNPALLGEMGQVLAAAGVKADVTVRSGGKDLPLCECIRRRKGDSLYLFILRNVAPSATPTGEAGDASGVGTAPIDIEVTLAEPGTVTNVRTGKVLGEGPTFTDTLLPYEANVYQVSRPR